MTLPTGQISLSEVNVELGLSATATISLNDAAVRTLAGVPSGAISMQNLQGKSNEFAFTISTNQTNANLRTLAVNAGWNESSKVVATIGSGIYVSSNATGTPALTVSGSFPNGVDLINSGFIIGMGGAGGDGTTANESSFSGGTAGSAGGLALSVSTAISITNNGTIGGGGGGGGGGRGGSFPQDETTTIYMPGGGGGGGRSSNAANSSGGARGRGLFWTSWDDAVAGSAGTVSAAGAGGKGGDFNNRGGGTGGTGGAWGAAGADGGAAFGTSVTSGATRAGGAGGGAVSGNSNITWVATGTRLGAIT